MLEQNKLDTFYHACIDGNFEVIKGFLEQKENREDLLDYQDFHVWKMVCASNLRVNILNYLIEVSTEKDRDRAFADNIHKLLKSACQFNYKDIFDTLINAIPSSQLSSVLKQNNHELL